MFSLSYPLFWLWAIFRGDAQWREKNLSDFQMQNFMLNLLGKKIVLKQSLFQKLARPWKSMMCFGPIWNIWTNLGYSKGLFEKIWKLQMFCISFVYLLLHVTHMQDFKKNVCLQSCCWCEIGVKWPIAPTNNNRDSFGNFIYTTFVCNDTPLSQTISNFKSWS